MTSYGVLNGEVQQANIQKIKEGWRICTSCQHVNIEPGAADFVTKCPNCYKCRFPSRFCRHCGSPIEASRIDYARKNGGEAKQCGYCAKMPGDRARPPHPHFCSGCDCLHPDSWDCLPLPF